MNRLRFSRDLIVPAYVVGILGAFLQISGGFWDVAYHTIVAVDTFLTIPHLVLYTGVGLSLLASVTGFGLRRALPARNSAESALMTGLKVSLAGGILQIIAGPSDFLWHQTYGFDPYLFTPTHSLLITGIILNSVGMAIATTRLVQASRTGVPLGHYALSTRWLQLAAIVSFATLWMALNGLVYLVTDARGIGYTFHLGQDWPNQVETIAFIVTEILLAGVGSLVLLTTKNALPWKGALSAVTLLSALVVSTTTLGFRVWYLTNSGDATKISIGTTMANFIPLYFLFIIPVVAFDILIRKPNGMIAILASSLVAPFSAYLDGFYSVQLWTSFTDMIPMMTVPMLVAGAIAALSESKFLNLFVSNRINQAMKLGVK